MSVLVWTNGKHTVTGSYYYQWSGDFFVVTLDQRDRIMGQQRVFRVYGERPEWGNWRLKGIACHTGHNRQGVACEEKAP